MTVFLVFIFPASLLDIRLKLAIHSLEMNLLRSMSSLISVSNCLLLWSHCPDKDKNLINN